MKFIQKFSFICARGLASTLNENHQKRSIYYYSFQVIWGAIIKGVILISTSLLLGILIPAIIIMFAFSSLRMLAGGYHMTTYGKCILASTILFVVSGLISQYTYQAWSVQNIIILLVATLITGLYVLRKYAPKDTPNKPITDPKQIKKLKVSSTTYLFVLLAVIIVLALAELNMYVIALCSGILLELFTITPAGHRFFDRISKL